MLPHTELQQRDIDQVISFLYPDPIVKIPDAFGRIPPAAQTRNGRHPRIVPTGDKAFIHQLQQLALAHDRITEVQPRKLVLMGWEYFQLVDEPVIKRPVWHKLQRTDGMRNLLDGIA